jgi:hypothetical protein
MILISQFRMTGYPTSPEGQDIQKKFWNELVAKLEEIAPGSISNL